MSKYNFFLLFAIIVLFSSCNSKEKILIETDYGNMVIELRDDTPKHRDNILKLAKEGFYDDLIFHRVIENFMIQGGDPDSKTAAPGQMLGSGGPGYTIDAEITGGLHIKGAVAAARRGDNGNPERKSSGSQFYIVQGVPITADNIDTQLSKSAKKMYTQDDKQAYIQAGAGYPALDSSYTVFGQVVEGLEVIDKIAAVKKGANDRPVQDIKMKVSVIK